MASLILPVWQSLAPKAALELDTGNRFGVTALAVHGFAATKRGVVVPAKSANIASVATGSGLAYSLASSSNDQVTFGSSDDWRPQFPFSVMMGWAPSIDSAAGQFATAHDGNSNMGGWALITTGSTTSFKLCARLGDNAGVLTGNRSDFTHSTRITLNTRHVGGAIVRSMTDADVILDGVLETPTRGGSGASMIYGSGGAGFGGRTTQSLTAGAYDFLLVCGRALSKSEWDDLAANPYQVLRARPRRLFVAATAGSGQTIDPSKGSVTVSGKTPTVEQTITVAPSAGGVDLTGKQPIIEQPIGVSPSARRVSITGYAPTVDQGAGLTLTPAMAHVALTGQQPTVQQDSGVSVFPSAGRVTVSGKATTISQPMTVAPAAGHVLLSGGQPIVVSGAQVTPQAGRIAISGYAATIEQPRSVTPSAGSILVGGKLPTVSQQAASAVIAAHRARYSNTSATSRSNRQTATRPRNLN